VGEGRQLWVWWRLELAGGWWSFCGKAVRAFWREYPPYRDDRERMGHPLLWLRDETANGGAPALWLNRWLGMEWCNLTARGGVSKVVTGF
jgi:hypothetical protein